MKVKILSITLLIVLTAFCIVSIVKNSQPKEPKQWSDYTVKSGDTVCEIAQNITPNSEDYRKTQYFIIKKNNIKNALIFPGQTILIPAKPKIELKNIGKFKLTAYCHCVKCCGKSDGITASGKKATQGRTIAVDPCVIPYGTKVIIDSKEYVAEDCGGAIKENQIDIYFASHSEALKFGVQYKDVYIKGVGA